MPRIQGRDGGIWSWKSRIEEQQSARWGNIEWIWLIGCTRATYKNSKSANIALSSNIDVNDNDDGGKKNKNHITYIT